MTSIPVGLITQSTRDTCRHQPSLFFFRALFKGVVRKIGKFEAIIIFSIPKLTIRDQFNHFVDNPFNIKPT